MAWKRCAVICPYTAEIFQFEARGTVASKGGREWVRDVDMSVTLENFVRLFGADTMYVYHWTALLVVGTWFTGAYIRTIPHNILKLR